VAGLLIGLVAVALLVIGNRPFGGSSNLRPLPRPAVHPGRPWPWPWCWWRSWARSREPGPARSL